MNFRKLLTYLTVGTAAVIPFAGAQNPTILQGSYISNVFGNSNFVLNPNAQTNIANVTTVTATVTRSTTTPLVATSEFTVAIGTANGTATWATRAFDQGMKGQNCEARFTYRGFAATSKVHIKQGANAVASLNLTPATDPRIASINFPCGDLSTATTFVVTDTAILAGTNEIGGIYVGLATNMANVAQAEVVVRAISNTSQTLTNGGTDILVFGNEILDTNNQYNNSTGVFTAAKAGTYLFNTRVVPTLMGVNAQLYMQYQKNNVVSGSTSLAQSPVGAYYPAYPPLQEVFTLNVGETVKIQAQLSGDSVNRSLTSGYSDFTVTRFPSSSELVVTPERQNTWGAVEYRNSQQTLFSGSAEPTGYSSFNNATWNQPTLLKGKAAVTTTNSGNDLGFSIPNLPVGSYKLEISGYIYPQAGAVVDDVTLCTFRIAETDSSGTLRSTVAEQVIQGGRPTVNTNTINAFLSFQGIYTNTAVTTRNFRLEANKTYDSNSTNTGTCRAEAYASGSNAANIISFTITPLDQPSNSALYVQGPVLGAQTGAAIPAGYVGEELTCSFTGVTITTAQTNLCTISNVTPGVYLAFIGADSTQGSSTRIAGFTEFTTGTATVTWSRGAYQEWARSVESGGTTFQSTDYGRVTVGGTITFRAISYNASSTFARGKIHMVRLN